MAKREGKKRSPAAVKALATTRKLRDALVALAKTDSKGHTARRNARKAVMRELRNVRGIVDRCYPAPPKRPKMPLGLWPTITVGRENAARYWANKLARYAGRDPQRAVRCALIECRRDYGQTPPLSWTLAITEHIVAACKLGPDELEQQIQEGKVTGVAVSPPPGWVDINAQSLTGKRIVANAAPSKSGGTVFSIASFASDKDRK